MEVQKFRIKRINPDIHWEIPCSGGTNFWPINTSTNCSGVTMYNATGIDVMSAINGDILNIFPEELKHCSPIDPCVILWNTGPSSSPFHCTSIDGFQYTLFKGLNVTLSGNTYTDSFNQTQSVISVGNASISPVNITPNTFGCECQNPLGEQLSKIPIFISQDFNDIGHYSVWDGNISQQEIFANFIFSGVSSGGMDVLVTNTTDFGYYETFQKSPYTIDWGVLGMSTQVLYYPSLTTQSLHTYTTPGQYTITITQDSPWGPLSTSKVITVPLETYAVMAGSVISPTNPTLQMDQASPLLGPMTYDIFGNPSGFQGGSTGYFNDYPNMPLDSGTHINQYSGMTFGAGSQGGQPCFTVSGITDSILGNFQTYTNSNTANLPPGFNAGVTVPIGGDVLDPITNGFLTGVYGTIDFAGAAYTAYTISSAANSTGVADGDTPIRFWDFNNGITIFEATSCGLDNLAWGAEECIACPSGDCEYCTTKDEYIDRVTGVPHSIGPGVVVGDWSPSGNYSIGDIVYDVTFNSCCCYMAVTNISSSDPWFGTAPVMMEEGTYNDGGVYTHVWEACAPECVSCPPGTNTPCNDFTLVSYIYSSGNFYNAGDYVEGEYGNCYQALVSGTLSAPTGYTMQYSTEWDYIGCVSWICPVEGPEANCDYDCISNPPINGIWNTGQMNSAPFGWLGGVWNSGFGLYFENDTANYNGVCYVCLNANVAAYFPCSDTSTYGPPDTSPMWQACPLPGAGNLDCIMISGATLDTLDQFGNPITVTGEMFWGDCNINLISGTCFENRWKCISQYSCQGCIPILSDDPLYFTPLSFATEQDCIDYCEPPAYSCTTPSAVGVPCCDEINCFLDEPLYVNTMISVNAINSTATDLAYNHNLFISPIYDINDCNDGVAANTLNNLFLPPMNIAPNGAILECCINTVWTWNCETGCESTGGLPSPGPLTIGSEIPGNVLWPTSADCEQNMLIYYGVANVIGDVPCSWWCEDPFLPYNPPSPGPYQSPCIPCYSISSCPPVPIASPGGAGPFPTEAACVTACTSVQTCWLCDCDNSTPCVDTWPDPCPTLISQNPNLYGPDPSGGLNGIVSFPNQADCLDFCQCNFGWDCFTDTGQTPSINVGCQLGSSLANINALGWQTSDPDPLFTGYTNYSACCYANEGCCYAKCDDDPTSNLNQNFYPPTGIPSPLVDWPCSYEVSLFVTPGPPAGCNDPTQPGYIYDPNLPWCFMFDCTNALCSGDTYPTCCDEESDACDCACQAPVNSMGAWDSLYNFYDLNDAVYWGDTDTDFCCFKCHCDIILPPGQPFTPGDASTYDCNHFTPGDPPHMGVPNCWRSCNQTPGPIPLPFVWQGTSYNPCSACTSGGYDPGYSCTPDGCQPSGCNPGLGTGPLVNCYSGPTCDDGSGPECVAQCFCVPGTSPCLPMCATYQQELILASGPIPTDCPPNVYAYNSYNECMGINPVNLLLPDCCPTVRPPQWYCDDSAPCSSNYPPVVNVDGTGCVQVNSGHAQYQDPITTNFTSLANCQQECNWCCDKNGLSVCTFVGNITNCAGTAYINALDCYLATATNTPCDCSLDAKEIWCHYDQVNDIGGCVSNTSGLLDVNLFGSGGLDRATDPGGFFTSLGNCKEACKFCCDCDISGECLLNWYCAALNPGGTYGCACHSCYEDLSLCAVNEEPCVTIYQDYYCDDILGCVVYPVINNLISGPYTGPSALSSCQKVCQFECNDACVCEVTSTPTNPLNWSPPCFSLACCDSLTTFGEKCCGCDECENGTYPYSYDNGLGVLLTYWITITTFNNTPLGWSPAGNPVTGGPYQYGDIVTQDGCCYIMILADGDWSSYDTTMLPSDYYNIYMNVMNTTGLPVYGTDIMWIPCDADCPPVTYKERWWCDSNLAYNTTYPNIQHSQSTNCVQEYPYIDNQVNSIATYGDFVYGTAGNTSAQLSYNLGATPFDSLAECQELCVFCCDPTPTAPCCCCKDDGFGQCSPGTSQSPVNPLGLPCDQACANLTLIECPPAPCCCCEDDGQGGCLPNTQQMMFNPTGLPCNQVCSGPGIIECKSGSGLGNCKICCRHDDSQGGTTFYVVQGPIPCKCAFGDTQVGMGNCGIMPNLTNASSPRSYVATEMNKEAMITDPTGPLGPLGPVIGPGGLIPATNAGPSPCCIVCQTPGGSQYQVNGFNPPGCKCQSFLDLQLQQPCITSPPVSQPCYLDWNCNTCANDCHDSYYSCMTLTNNCSQADCADCVGKKIEWIRQGPGFNGYFNPILHPTTGQFTMSQIGVPATFDGWFFPNVIPHSTPQTWTNTEPYWNYGQIVIDPSTPDCCWVRTVMWDTNDVPNLTPDQYSPTEHWCNYLSGNSADGANMYNPIGGTGIGQTQQGGVPGGGSHPWWAPCDKKCVSCPTGGTPTLTWKCQENVSLSVGCVQGNYPPGDPHVFTNQQDCNDKCWSWLCNTNPFWGTYSKCSTTNHSGVVGSGEDFINFFINHVNPNLQAINMVYTLDAALIPSPSFPTWVTWPPVNTYYPCPITTGPNAAGYLFTVDSALLHAHYTNSGNGPCAFTLSQAFSTGSDWASTYTNVQINYNTHIENCISLADVNDVMRNDNCQYTPGPFATTHPCFGLPGAGTLAVTTVGSEKFNDSGLYTDPGAPTLLCQVYDASKTSYASQGCCVEMKHHAYRACPCNFGSSICDCWQITGTGTTGGPGNVWDYAFPIDDYTGCTHSCCQGTCGCCEPNLQNAGYIGPNDNLTWVGLGASSFSTTPSNKTLQIGECFMVPDGTYAGGNYGPDVSGLWNYGTGTLSGGCCVCCVAGGTGIDPDPLNDGIPGNCFFTIDSSDGSSGQSGLWDIFNLYEYDGQFVSCGVDENCDGCGTGIVPL